MGMTRCPYCDNPLTLTELDRGSCPACRRSLDDVPEAAPRDPYGLTPSDDAAFGELGRLRAHAALGWVTLRTALSLLVVGMVVFYLCLGVLVVWSEVSKVTSRPSTELLDMVVPVLIIGLIGGAGLVLTVPFLSCAVPRSAGARGWVIGCLVALALAVVTVVFWQVANYQNRVTERKNVEAASAPQQSQWRNGHLEYDPPPTPKPLPWSTQTFQITVVVLVACLFLARNLYLLFLWKVSYHIHAPVLAVSYAVLFLFSILCDGLQICVLLLSMKQGFGEIGPARLLGPDWPWLAVPLGFVYFCAFVALALALRSFVAKHALAGLRR
jgi:hypothetical protein